MRMTRAEFVEAGNAQLHRVYDFYEQGEMVDFQAFIGRFDKETGEEKPATIQFTLKGKLLRH